MQSLLAYWKPETADREIGRGCILDHSASDQFDRVHVGDHVWIVTVREGELLVLGRIIVGDVTDQAGAARLMKTADLWPASLHIVASAGTAEPVREVSIPNLADSLRFKSKYDRLRVEDGNVNAQQLQKMRVLTPACAVELEAAFRRAIRESGRSRQRTD